jgi:hypothetical protein
MKKKWVLVLELQEDGELDRFPIATVGFLDKAGPWKVLKAIEEAEQIALKAQENTGEDMNAEIALLDACAATIKKISKRK